MDEFTGLLQDPAHWAFEMTTDVVFTSILFLLGRIPFKRWVTRHDQKHHDGHTS